MDYHVLIPDAVDKAALAVFEKVEAIKVTAPGGMKREDTLAAIAEADAMIIRSSTTADAELLAAANKLKAIARAGVGVDNIDVEAASAKGIIVMNTPAGNTVATAEETLALMLGLARHVPQAHASLLAGNWDRKTYMGTELRGKTLGVIGFGRIGQAVAKRAAAFEMSILAHDPFIGADHPALAAAGGRLVGLDELYAQADYITLHAVITKDNVNMINKDSLARMKKGVRIINAARGALIVEEDLAEAIKSGQVAGAALDVYAIEPPPQDNPLIGLQNVIHTPHLAASTKEAQVAVAVEAAELIVDGLLNGRWNNVVNPQVLG